MEVEENEAATASGTAKKATKKKRVAVATLGTKTAKAKKEGVQKHKKAKAESMMTD